MPARPVDRVRRLLRFWLTLDEPVDRRRYLLHGAGLMLFKYAVDASVVWLTAGVLWTPVDYLSPFYLDRIRFTGSVAWLDWAFVAWTLPFLWIGVSMTVRRAADAGLSPWLVLLFFVPFVNYALMLTLAAVPSRAPDGWRETPTAGPVGDEQLRSALLGAGLGVLISVGMVFRSAVWLEEYSALLFVATPFVLGATCAFIYNHGHPRSGGDTAGVVTVSVLVAGGAILLFALEGALCIFMAMPLALPVAILGGVLGRAIALRSTAPPSPGMAALVVLPLLLPTPGPPPAQPFEVVTSVEIDAPPEAVWEHVVGFEELPPPGRLVFRLGIAYPQRARIDGEGVGAIRRCEFSTGAFVEPITAWEPGRRLSFDVVRQPPPLEEWSPYASVHPPHLDGYFRSVRGEFRLVPLPGGRTRLEGSTWYELDLAPVFYWRIQADWLVHRIHERVLEHVKARAEAGGGSPVQRPRASPSRHPPERPGAGPRPV